MNWKKISAWIVLSAVLGCAVLPLRGTLYYAAAAAVGGPITITDTFNRADVAPIDSPTSDGLGNWTSAPGTLANNVDIVSNRADGTGSDSIAVCTPISGTWADDQQSTITISSTSSVGAVARIKSTTEADGYMLYVLNTTTLQFYELSDNGATTSITQIGANVTVAAIVAGDTIGLRVETSGGNAVLTAYKNGSAIVEADNPHTDSTGNIWTSGLPGVLCDGASAHVQEITMTDNF